MNSSSLSNVIRIKSVPFLFKLNHIHVSTWGPKRCLLWDTADFFIVHEWLNVRSERGQVDVVFLNFANTFDFVPHQRLISKVDYCGIQGNLKLWIKDFLNYWSPAACSDWWFVLQLVSAQIWRTTRNCIGSNKVPHVTYNVKRVSVRTSLFVAARFALHQCPKLPWAVQRICRPIIMPF